MRCWQEKAEKASSAPGAGTKVSPKSTAYRAIAAHEVFGKCPTVGHFFDARAIYLLSAGSCPEAATAEAIQLAEKGDYIDEKLAKAIAAKHAPKDTPSGKQLAVQPDVESAAGDTSATTQDTGATSVDARATADDDVAVSTADIEQQTTENGLVGLQAVISALEGFGIYAEYREVLDRIRVALEQNASEQEAGNEEMVEWTL